MVNTPPASRCSLRVAGRMRGSSSCLCSRRYRDSAPGPTTHPSSHPVRLRPTHRGAVVVQGVKVERATVRTTLTPWAATARLCLGRRWSGWEPPRRSPRSGRHSRAVPRPSRSLSAPAGGIVVKPRTWFSSHAQRAYTAGARRRRQRRAGRRQERGRSQSREARPAERSAAGCLDEVEKPVTALVVRRVPRSRRRRPACLRRCGRPRRCVASRGVHRGGSRLRPSSRPPAPSAGACLGRRP